MLSICTYVCMDMVDLYIDWRIKCIGSNFTGSRTAAASAGAVCTLLTTWNRAATRWGMTSPDSNLAVQPLSVATLMIHLWQACMKWLWVCDNVRLDKEKTRSKVCSGLCREYRSALVEKWGHMSGLGSVCHWSDWLCYVVLTIDMIFLIFLDAR